MVVNHWSILHGPYLTIYGSRDYLLVEIAEPQCGPSHCGLDTSTSDWQQAAGHVTLLSMWCIINVQQLLASALMTSLLSDSSLHNYILYTCACVCVCVLHCVRHMVNCYICMLLFCSLAFSIKHSSVLLKTTLKPGFHYPSWRAVLTDHTAVTRKLKWTSESRRTIHEHFKCH